MRTASTVGDWLDVDRFESAAYFLAYYLSSQLLLRPVIYAFTRINWHALFGEWRWKWLARPDWVTIERPSMIPIVGNWRTPT